MRLLLVSGYELGHQPLHAASPAAALSAAGHEVRAVDLSVAPLTPADVDWAEAVAVSVPMHTATRLAVAAVTALRARRPALPVCAYGLYAATAASGDGRSGLFDQTIAGEYETGLVSWAAALAGGDRALAEPALSTLRRERHRVPDRSGLPSLERYARLAVAGEERLSGYTEASHGCSHRCRHCPVPTVYGGRVRPVELDTVLADVDQLVSMGAEHVTFGDPDFLNMPGHAMRVVRAVHDRHPALTFDVTAKVEHLLRHRALVPELAAAGLLFVVSAFESLDDGILARLDKGHTAAEASEAVGLLRAAGVEVRPSFLPFTPWSSVSTIVDIVDFVGAHYLAGSVDAVQYSIRLLVPEGSLLLDDPGTRALLGPYDPEALSYTWRSPSPQVDELQSALSAVAEECAPLAPEESFLVVHRVVSEAARSAGLAPPAPAPPPVVKGRPRLTEPWFCCAEPTAVQLTSAAPPGPGPGDLYTSHRGCA